MSDLRTVTENEADGKVLKDARLPDSPLDPGRVSRAADYLDDYLQFVPNPDRKRLAHSVAELKQRIAGNGVAPVTVVLKVGRKDRSTG